MTTPVEQTVPDEFQDELDLPAPGQVDQAALTKAKSDLAKQQSSLRTQNAAIASYKKKMKAAGKDRTKVKWYEAQIARLEKGRAATQTKLDAAQNKVYETGGEYDKLLSGENRDAFLALKSLFGQYGLGSLAGKIYDYVKQGYGADTIGLLLQDTKEYKTRFAGNEARAKAGLAVLNPADYLATEAAYRQVLSSAGLPKGFYDNPADFTRWIADDVSPTEIKGRVDMAVAATGQANPQYKQALWQMYGINESDLTAYFLDRKRAEPILKKQAAAGAIGAAAIRRGFGANVLDLESYATLGITADQAEQAYAQISEGFESMLGIAGRYGTTWTQREAEQELFTPGATTGGKESASEKGKRLKSQERAQFAGSRGSSIQGLNAGYSQT
ncbi:hypothetical protein [Streptomyces himalayensis]|uniref:Uncharacterized protein n=1 Tax=Streptomyces himalayensis subsp. himalayensis TaxID=2756131 RepID=A0A7W0DUE6_9ACTN|nr:hypothetical protein [Streptomyces himalayensis]MBA2951434.1 hypothetical protein [Streptomyces himalayensis subsp. himalayensis]